MSKYSGYFLVILVIFLQACKEETRVNEVQGFLRSDCSTPISNTEVALKINPGESFSETIIMATDISDQNGAFHFTYELEEVKRGKADLIIVGESSYQNIIENLPLNRDLDVVGYLQNRSALIFTLTGPKVYQPTDTLFYAIEGGEEYSWVQPTTGASDTIFSDIGIEYEATEWRGFYFGVGSAEFELSKEALTIEDSTYNNLYFEIQGCKQNETFDLYIE
jgi:hypothetical protein